MGSEQAQYNEAWCFNKRCNMCVVIYTHFIHVTYKLPPPPSSPNWLGGIHYNPKGQTCVVQIFIDVWYLVT